MSVPTGAPATVGTDLRGDAAEKVLGAVETMSRASRHGHDDHDPSLKDQLNPLIAAGPAAPNRARAAA